MPIPDTPVAPASLTLASLPPGYRALVVGASGALGAAFAEHLRADPRCAAVRPLSRGTEPALDLADEAGIAAAAARLAADGPWHLLVVATGLLHGPGLMPEKRLADLSFDALQRVFQVNVFGPALLLRHFAPLLARERALVGLLSAKVGSIGDNRLGGWYAYRAAKAAQNQLLKTFSIELQRLNPQACCLLLHPGTVDTELSRPFQGSVARERLFSADTAAGHLLAVIAAATPADNGRFIAWDGRDIAW
jgi:NAD(P)-dependent dehydrogenase (short-subunit alcohol dehydrogenase family)